MRASPASAWSCALAKDIVPVASSWTVSMSKRLAHPAQVRAGTVCRMCARPGPAEGCSELCRQWNKQ